MGRFRPEGRHVWSLPRSRNAGPRAEVRIALDGQQHGLADGVDWERGTGGSSVWEA